MVLYRRNRVAGGTYFFAVVLRNRRLSLLVDRIDDLRESVRTVLRERPFRIDVWVVLPEHLHAVWTLPPGDHDYSARWKAIKSGFTRRLAKAEVPIKKNARAEYDVWQRRFWEHTILEEADLAHHVDYVHYNPVKHGWAKWVWDWPHSTFHRSVGRGLYAAEWAGEDREWQGEYGESPPRR